MLRRALSAAVGLVVATVAAFSAMAENGTLDRITRTGTVRVAIPDNFPPFGDLGLDAKPRGYDIDVAMLVAEALGAKPELIAVASPDRVPYLTAGKVDLVISSLGKNAEREKSLDFSIAYAPFYSGIFGPDEVQVAKPDDLAGKTIAVTRDTIEDAALTEVAPSTATIKRYDDNGGTAVAFLFNQTDLIATGNVAAADLLASDPRKKPLLKFLLRNSPCYIGINKGDPELRARIDAVIAAALKDGRLDAISMRWLKRPVGNPEHPDLIAAK
jgi:polar amino acid transport system substrate-binding protein